MQNAFHSHAEIAFFAFSLFSVCMHVVYVQFLTRGQSDLAKILEHRRTQVLATLYLRLGVVGYLAFNILSLSVYLGVLIHLHWHVALGASCVIATYMFYVTLRKFQSLSAADLAEARHFMDYDLKPMSRFNVR